MSPYLNNQELREFEDRNGWKVIIEKNKIIGKFLDFAPEVEWMVGNNDGSCFHPKSCGSNTPEEQKRHAENWLSEQKERFPNGFVVREGNEVIKKEYYPSFHLDWNHIMEAIRRLKLKGINVSPSMNIFDSWNLVYDEVAKHQVSRISLGDFFVGAMKLLSNNLTKS